MSEKISVALLVYNEGATIVETVKSGYQELMQQNLDFELWVIDNHSTDNTEKDIRALLPTMERLRYQRHPFNLGYSLSSQSSFKIPKADYYFTIDGDGQYTLLDITEHLNLLRKGADVVYSIRARRNDPILRKIMSAVFNFISNIVLRTGLKDLNCGFRGLSARAASQIKIYNQIVFVGPEIYVRAKLAGLNITERPVRHFHRRAGQSVFLGLAGIYRATLLMLKFIFKLRRELLGKESPQNTIPTELENASYTRSELRLTGGN